VLEGKIWKGSHPCCRLFLSSWREQHSAVKCRCQWWGCPSKTVVHVLCLAQR